MAHVVAHGGNLTWCHGRTSALPFYRAVGFREHGEEFEAPVTGPHLVLRRAILTMKGKTMFKQMREPVNGLTHYFAALVAVIGMVVLLMISRGDSLKQETLLVYGGSLVLMLMASASYHLIRGSPRRIQFLRKIDHSSIFILIAGTYTPICVNLMSGFWQWGMLLVVWTLALIGTFSKILLINTPRWFSAAVYLVMGWLALLAANDILAALPPGALVLLVLGGLAFTFGAIVYITKTMNFMPGVFGFHEVWHIFVIVGCLCHFVLMLVYIAPIPSA